MWARQCARTWTRTRPPRCGSGSTPRTPTRRRRTASSASACRTPTRASSSACSWMRRNSRRRWCPITTRGPTRSTSGRRSRLALSGTLINVGTVLLGTLIGVLIGRRLPSGLQERVMAGLGLVTLVLGVDNALQWRDTNPIIVFAAVLLGGIVGEAIGIERALGRLGDYAQSKLARGGGHSRISEGF